MKWSLIMTINYCAKVVQEHGKLWFKSVPLPVCYKLFLMSFTNGANLGCLMWSNIVEHSS